MSGAGHKADQSLIFAKVNESVRSYGLPCHRPSLRSTPFLPPPLRSAPVRSAPVRSKGGFKDFSPKANS